MLDNLLILRSFLHTDNGVHNTLKGDFLRYQLSFISRLFKIIRLVYSLVAAIIPSYFMRPQKAYFYGF